MRIAVTDGIDPNAKLSLESLGHSVIEKHYSNDELISGCISDFDIVIIRSATKLNSNIIKSNAGVNGKLSLIIRAGVGVDNIDLSSASDYSISVCNTPNASTNAVVELTIGHLISSCRNIARGDQKMKMDPGQRKSFEALNYEAKIWAYWDMEE